MIELNNKYWKEQNEDEILNEIIKTTTKATLNGDILIYQPARQQHRMFYYDILNYYYRNMILLLKNGATLDDLQLFANHYWIWCFNPPKIPITFEEFINNRSLSKYIQKASKEINYGNSNRNRNNN